MVFYDLGWSAGAVVYSMFMSVLQMGGRGLVFVMVINDVVVCVTLSR